MTSPKVYVLEHRTDGVWRPLVSGVRRVRVTEHQQGLIDAGDCDAGDLRVTVYEPRRGRGVDR